jgi:hypothetical protein
MPRTAHTAPTLQLRDTVAGDTMQARLVHEPHTVCDVCYESISGGVAVAMDDAMDSVVCLACMQVGLKDGTLVVVEPN